MKSSRTASAIRFALVLAVAFAAAGGTVAFAAPRSVSGPPADAFEQRRTADGTGRVVVGYRRGVSAAALSAVEDLGAETVSASARGGFAVVEPPQGVSAEQFAETIEDAAGVRYAHPERVVRAAAVPSDGFYAGNQWNLKSIGCESAWDRSFGLGVRVAVLDTGIMGNHVDLAGQVVLGKNFIDPTRDWQDDDGHGTHVAGVIAASMNGVGVAGIAPKAQLLAGKVLDANGTGSDTGLAEAIRWAADNGAHIINMSIESPEYSQPVEDACEYARGKGSLLVAASGNEGTNRVSYPAVFPGVISVGSLKQAVELDPPFAKSDFSNHGYELDIMAPGEAIRSSVFDKDNPAATNMYADYSGTSMAAPHVAGVLALARSLNLGLSRQQLEYALLQRSRDIGDPGRDRFHGAGVVQADEMARPVPPAADVDGDIPGLPLVTSPVHGTLNAAAGDDSDVYEIHVLSGERVTFTLTGAPGTDFRVEVFAREASSISNGPMATGAAGAPVAFSPQATGSVFVRVRAIAGAGDYTLSHAIATVPHADDEIPGVVPVGTTVTGVLDAVGDTDDVYAVTLQEGQGLTVGLTGEPYTDFDAYLFSPAASSVHTMTGLVAGAAEDGSTESFSYSVPAGWAGRYYVDAAAYLGGGAYTLTYRIGSTTRLSLSAPTTCAWSGSAAVSGRLTTAIEGKPVPGRVVRVWASTDMNHWAQVASSGTDAWGNWSTSVKPKRRTYYIAEFEGDPLSSGGVFTYSESDLKTITPRAYLTRPYAPNTTYRNRTWTASGFLRPKHTNRARTVKIVCYRLQNNKWVARKSLYTINNTVSQYTTKYQAKVSLPYRGKWKLVASVPGDSLHVATKSSARYVTVK